MDELEASGKVAGLRARIRRFVDDEVVPVERDVLDLDRLEALRGLMARAKEEGLWALGHPQEIGGGGLAFRDYVHVNEVIGRSAPAAVALGTHTLQDAIMLQRFGTGEQRERWLEPVVAGDHFVSLAMTEPEVAGSDPKLMRTSTAPEGDGWYLDGHKWFVEWADRAVMAVVFAKTDPTARLHRQFSAFLIPTDTPGYDVERLLPVMGDDTSHYGEVRLRHVHVPASNLLGELGDGFTIAQSRLQPGRMFDAMRWLGQAERAFESMVTWANHRFSHGSLLRDKGEVQRYVAESAAQIHGARLMILDTARSMDRGDDTRVATSIVKFTSSRMLHDVIDRAIQVHGAIGVSGDLPLEAMYRAARTARLYDGPDEVHRMFVARELLDDLDRQAPWCRA